MQSEEQRLIDGLFERLKQAESNTSERDANAEAIINAHMQNQPAAPYYMAQTLLIQEAALKQLHSRIQELESQVSQLQNTARQPKSSGSFLSGLFGGGSSHNPDPIPGSRNYSSQAYAQPGYNQPAQQTAAPAQMPFGNASRGSGFLSGALQTAAGVAGGVVLGNMLTGLFQHSRPEEVVNIINEPDSSQTQDPAFLDNAGTDLPFDNSSDYNDFDDNNDTFMDNSNDFGDDDDNWV